ncbi:MAG TPA: glutamyl-tRNA reductase [Thermodesulfobacteriota bacterium]|nr:glutamyl-tRNA reductase [Thermodesulfobacteriota bacterium]
MRVVVVGLSYKTAPVEVRERFSFSQPVLEAALTELYKKASVEECLILSTCNRVEIYAVSENIDNCVEGIKEFLSEFHKVSPESFSSYLYISIGHMAIRHMFRVASSIESMVIGEPQILGQIKQAYKIAVLKRTVGLILTRLCHVAFSVAKRVRAETKIGTHAVSVSRAAVELAKRIFDDLSKRTVMLIGAGDMAELAAQHLIRSGIKDIVIANRTFENAESLAEKLKGKPIRIEEVYYSLKNVDILITATGSTDFIIKPQHVRKALKLRSNEPMFMIDIAVPRDIDPRVEEIENVYLYDIDDLKGVLDENLQMRRENIEKAEEIILYGERYFQRWLNGLKIVPTIILLRKRLEEIKAAELRKALGKLNGYSDKDKNVIESMVSGIIGKILHSPITRLKKESSTSMGALYVDAINELFELDKQFEFQEEEDYEASVKDWE